MTEQLETYLRTLKAHGKANNIPNVSESLGQFLNMLIRIKKPRMILEIGCANGYSTIWMAEAAEKIAAKIHTIDHSLPTFQEAKKNIEDVKLTQVVNFHFGEAVDIIKRLPSAMQFDLVFVDGEKASYWDFWKVIEGRLASGAVVIFDDMMAFPEKTKIFEANIRQIKELDRLLIPLDMNDGIYLIMKSDNA